MQAEARKTKCKLRERARSPKALSQGRIPDGAKTDLRCPCARPEKTVRLPVDHLHCTQEAWLLKSAIKEAAARVAWMADPLTVDIQTKKESHASPSEVSNQRLSPKGIRHEVGRREGKL